MQSAIHSKYVVTPNGVVDATVFINEGKIASVEPGIPMDLPKDFTDFGDLIIMPGLVDSHVHVNEPGRTDWEGFETATTAAAAGGITTLVDMPLNSSPVTTTPGSFDKKLAATKGKLNVNGGFWGGLVPENADNPEPLLQSGVLGIKAFLTHSGIDEFPNVTEEDLRKAMPVIAKYQLPLLVHAELSKPHPGIEMLKKNPTNYQAYLLSRPKWYEDDAIEILIRLCEETGCKTHIVHLSSANSIQKIAAAKKRGLPITVETCPHYLVFNAENIDDSPGATVFKCAPPIREKENNDQLWQALKDGLIDFVVTDHSPSTPDLKELESGNFAKAWGGVAGLQFSLSAFWTAAEKRGFSIAEVSKLMSTNVANFCGFAASKGQIAAGFDADLMVFDPEARFKVKEHDILHKHKITPYLGMQLKGKVRHTILAGRLIFSNENLILKNRGSLLFSRFLRP